jgi:hypothetical protein
MMVQETIFYPTQSGDETGRSYTDLYTIISTDGGKLGQNRFI